MKRLVFHAEARLELAAAVAYYEEQQAGLGLDFLAEVQRTSQRIQRNPGIGAPYKTTRLRRCPVPGFPYGIFYLDFGDQVWIAAVAHAKRRPDYWRTRRSQ